MEKADGQTAPSSQTYHSYHADSALRRQNKAPWTIHGQPVMCLCRQVLRVLHSGTGRAAPRERALKSSKAQMHRANQPARLTVLPADVSVRHVHRLHSVQQGAKRVNAHRVEQRTVTGTCKAAGWRGKMRCTALYCSGARQLTTIASATATVSQETVRMPD